MNAATTQCDVDSERVIKENYVKSDSSFLSFSY